ncbi:Ig-like domain repeat protein [Solirubrobacter phytolaccae]|uniref:Ig-like domain repeat protein n=1 Tax=Solirubrobacter phytolaccae TaxID=1404360 RepID=A0A9X3N8B3_9ACTN|nr:choice-of-anchor Q domain-containing protein [Solirubrobacter phytolaccae]MDA0181840.1 Ig-like domain repeat protein [Solirubrobacter phytolaccae]
MFLLTVVACFAITPGAWAATYNVNTTDDVPGDCPATCSIRGAITAANANVDGDTIVIPAGQYSLTQTLALRVTNPVTITGAGANVTTITANPSVEIRALEIANATAAISGLTLQGGQALFGINGPHGGVLMAQSSTVTLDGIHVYGGSALSGGGIANRNGTMTINRSLIERNSATQGGGDGGGIINFGGDGGSAASLTIRNSTIASNTARLAGGLISYGSPQNTVTTEGVTIAQNHAGDRGTGAVQIGEGSWFAQLTLVADNFHEQTSSNCGGTKAVSNGWNVETSNGECGFTQEVDRRVLDAKLATSLDNNGGPTPTMALLPGSPAIDLLTQQSCPGVDQRGTLRPKGAGCDAGAFEAAYWVAITGGPEGGTRNATPTFTFGSTEGADGFRCRLEGRDAAFSPCTSPYVVTTALPAGDYTLHVEALLNGQPQGTAERSFVLDTQAPPAPMVTTPANNSFQRDTVVTFSGTAEPNVFIRILDETGAEIDSVNADGTGAWLRVTNLSPGQHDLNVVATDAVGDSAPTPVRVTVDQTFPVAQIDAGPTVSNGEQITYTYSANEPATFECQLVGWEPDAQECPATGKTYTDVDPGEYRFEVRAIDRAGNHSEAPARQNLVVDRTAPTVGITSGPPAHTGSNDVTFTYTSNEPDGTFICGLTGPGVSGPAEAPCPATGKTYFDLGDGAYEFSVSAVDRAGNRSATPDRFAFVVDTAATAAPEVSEAATDSIAATFTFSTAQAGRTLTCRLDGPGRGADFAPCASPLRYENLAAGDYRFTVRSTDSLGNFADAPVRTFTIAAPQPAQPTPVPTASPTPSPTPAPAPTVNEDVTIRPTGKVLVKILGTNQFVAVNSLEDIPLGSEIDTTNGRVVLRFETEKGKVQTGTFYGGIFKVTQVGKILDLKLTEPLAACPKKQGKASTAQSKKKKSRKLWGDGKGAFRTSGKYSAATVRGTKWLVQDTCSGTLTRVTSGVVAVRYRGKDRLVRSGKRFLAKPY